MPKSSVLKGVHEEKWTYSAWKSVPFCRKAKHCNAISVSNDVSFLEHFNNKTLIKNSFNSKIISVIRHFCHGSIRYRKLFVNRNLLLVWKIVFKLVSAVVGVMDESFITESIEKKSVEKQNLTNLISETHRHEYGRSSVWILSWKIRKMYQKFLRILSKKFLTFHEFYSTNLSQKFCHSICMQSF